jgi:hypothetical protein
MSIELDRFSISPPANTTMPAFIRTIVVFFLSVWQVVALHSLVSGGGGVELNPAATEKYSSFGEQFRDFSHIFKTQQPPPPPLPFANCPDTVS